MKRTLRIALPLCLVLASVPGVAQYCTSTSNYTNCASFEEYIGNVTIGSLNNSSACMNAPAYENYTALPGPTLTQASGTPISVTVGNWYSTTDTVTVFFDWNGNGILNDAGEVYPLVQGVGNAGGNTIYTGTITPPLGTVSTTRMRVKTVYGASSNPCGTSSWSNTEDYTVNILPATGLVATGSATPNPAVAGTPALFTVSISATSPPNPPTGASVTINLSAIGGSANQIMYDDGTHGDAIAGDNVFSVTANPSTNGNFLLAYSATDSAARTATGTISFGASPANDTCASSLSLNLGANGPFNNLLATDSGVVGSCATGYKDLWFNFTPACSGAYKIDTCTPAQFDTVLSVYSACGSGEMACNNNGTGCGGASTIGSVQLTAGVTVYIRVASVSTTATGSFNVNIHPVYTLTFGSAGPGTIGFALTGGPQSGLYYMAASFAPGNYPNGWFYGIDILFSDVIAQVNSGYPFVGGLDFCGGTVFVPVGGAPSNLTIWCVGLGFTGGLGIPAAATAPVTFTIP